MIKFNTLFTLNEAKEPEMIKRIIKDIITNPEELNLSSKKSRNNDYFTVDTTKRGVITIYKTFWVDGKRHLKYLTDDWKSNGPYFNYFQEKGIEVKVNDSGVNPDHVWIELQFSQAVPPEVADGALDVEPSPVPGQEPGLENPDLGEAPPEVEEEAVESSTPTKEEIVDRIAELVIQVRQRDNNAWYSGNAGKRVFIGRYPEFTDIANQIGEGEIGKAIKKIQMQRGDEIRKQREY